MTRSVALPALAVAFGLCLPQPLLAQDIYPSRPITMIVPFPPGGVADQTARPVAATMERLLKQPVVVSNRQGAGGAVGMAATANAKPDGYTIMTALSSISVIPEADKLFNRTPAYQMAQFAPIALVTADPTILVVPADSPWKTLAEFVADAKKRPGEISYSSSGLYGTLHLAMEMFAHAAGIKLKHVPFNGAGPALTALLGNHVQALASGPGVVIPQIQAGKLRPLANWGAKRIAAMPDVATFKELGYPSVEFTIWAGVFAPAGTPEPVLTVLRETMGRVVADGEFKSAMEKLQTPIAYLDAPEFRKFWDQDAQAMVKAVQAIGRVE
ncbi:MAG: tripartite tricarboxylate transporter substrate binding protein [Alphaproteobacteria bacterium]|nr:tripartite tricarboxylate transporter substrate binding protein [Alphaproteobacteria bacterium]